MTCSDLDVQSIIRCNPLVVFQYGSYAEKMKSERTLTESPLTLNPPSLTLSSITISPSKETQSAPSAWVSMWASPDGYSWQILTAYLKMPRPILSVRQISVFTSIIVLFLRIDKDEYHAFWDIIFHPTYRTSTVDCRISSIVHRLFESRPTAGACGKKAANEKAEEAHVIWKGMSCLIQNTLDAGRYN